MAKIKAVILDLDDTLFDCSGTLVESARKRAARAMVQAGLPCSEELAFKRQEELLKEFGPKCNAFDKLCEEFRQGEEASQRIVKAALDAYNSDEVENICLFPDVPATLENLRKAGLKLIIISSGILRRQTKKIELLGLKETVDLVLVHDIEMDESKSDCFEQALRHFKLKPQEIVSIGDRIHSEIKISNALGMHTVRFLHGRFKAIEPKNELEEADFSIKKISELPAIIKEIESGVRQKHNGLKIVAIGGGTGLPLVLHGLKKYTKNLTAIVTVTDSGRSTGKIREELNMVAPGDTRNCLVALSDSEQLMHKLFQYRFSEGKSFEGMSFGNLFLAALTKTTGSFEKAVKEAGAILAIKGKVLPSTLQNTHICAELEDGKIVEREFNVRALNKAPIKRLFLKPSDASALPDAASAIEEADLVVIGPGSLWGSIVSNLLVKGIPEAIRKTRGIAVYVGNIMTQPGQTDGFDAKRHVQTIIDYLGKGALDFVIINNKKPSKRLLKKYEAEKAFFIEPDKKGIEAFGVKVIEADVIEETREKREIWEKQDMLRHDSEKLARALLKLV